MSVTTVDMGGFAGVACLIAGVVGLDAQVAAGGD